MKSLTLASVIVAALGASANAEVISTFEGPSTEGWTYAGSPVTTTSTTGATMGSTYALAVDPNASFTQIQNPMSEAEFAIFKANDTLEVDVTVTDVTSGNFQLWLFVQSGTTSPVGGFYQIQGNTAENPATSINAPGTYTLSLDYSSLAVPSDAEHGYGSFRIIVNAGATNPSTLYIDNLRAVPEPASLALLGLGGLTMFRRRRA